VIRGLMSDHEWEFFRQFAVPSVHSKWRRAKDHRRTGRDILDQFHGGAERCDPEGDGIT
jgi:hypothetical protein